MRGAMISMAGETAATISTHVLDTGSGRPAPGVAVELAVRIDDDEGWRPHSVAYTDDEGRCTGLAPLPPHTRAARLHFATGGYFSGPDSDATGAFFPEVVTAFRVTAGEHFHIPLLLSPFGYTVYRGS